MDTPNRFAHRREGAVLLNAGTPALITGFLWATSVCSPSVWQIIAAFGLCWIPWSSYQSWRRQASSEVPLFALISSMYWVGYALPLFWSDHALGLVSGYHLLSEGAITKAMWLALVAVICIWFGMKIAKQWQWNPSTRLDLPENPWRWNYLRIVLVATALMRVLVPIDALGEGTRQIFSSVEVVISGVAFVILFRSYLRGKGLGVDKILLAGFLVVALVTGLSSGWLGSFVGLGIICVVAYIFEKRRFPVAAMLVVLPIILFLQPGKAKFRERYWKGGPSESYTESYGERIGFWVEASAQAWGRALTDPSGGGLRDLSGATLSRLSLLQPTANVIETTPARVPYQDGRLYSYLLVTFVPRFLWADKPSVSDANKWYQIAYNLTLPKDIENVGMAVGTGAESYINFGWFGPFLIIPCLGLLLGVFQQVFLRGSSGLFLSSIGVALLPGLLSIESQMAVYVSGIVQQVLFSIVVLAPVLVLVRRRSDQSTAVMSYASLEQR